jgi:hypothetical protein
MTIQRMGNVLVVVDDLHALSFCVELGMGAERQGGGSRGGGPSVSSGRRRPTGRHSVADPGRPRPNRAGDVPHAEGDHRRAEGSTANKLGIRRIMLAARR